MSKENLKKIKAKVTFDCLVEDNKIVACTNIDNSALFLIHEARKKGVPAIIIDMQHIDRNIAHQMLDNPIFKKLIVDNIDKAEKKGYCVGTTFFPQVVKSKSK